MFWAPFRTIMKNKRGFTLIEFLVIAAVIGLLLTLSIVALNQSRARARDARRVADIKKIQKALEMYYNNVSAFPPGTSLGSTITTNSVVYLDVIPTPPLPSDGAACVGSKVYTYAARTFNGISNGSYTLSYCLGSNTGGVPSGQNTASPSGIGLRTIP